MSGRTDTLDLLAWAQANVPYVKSSDTSRDAAESMRPHVSGMEMTVLYCVREWGGATCDEIEDRMKLAHQTVSARLKGLRDKGLIKFSGLKRTTRSGRDAMVYVAVAK
jgi:DNA-binding MarR family transcriptional regulator